MSKPCCHRWLLGVSGRWSACKWAVGQLDHDEEMEPMYGMHRKQDTGLEVQRSLKRAEETAFLCLLRKAFGRLVDVDFGETLHRFHQGISEVDTSRRIAPRRRSSNCRSVSNTSLKALNRQMSWEKRERRWMEELWRRLEPAQSNRKEKLMQRCSMQQAFTVWWNVKIVKSSSPSQERSGPLVNKVRQGSIEQGVGQQTSIGVLRCGRSSNSVKIQSKYMFRTKVVARRFQTQAGKMVQITFGRARHGEKSGSKLERP